MSVMLEREWEEGHAALEVLCDAGLVEECEIHGIFFRTGNVDLVIAYKTAMKNWTRYQGTFRRTRELTDKVKEVFEGFDYVAECCELCASRWEKD